MDWLDQGMNQVIGRNDYNHYLHKFDQFDERCLKKIFSKAERDHDMKKLFEEILLSEHLANVYSPGRIQQQAPKHGLINTVFEMDEIEGEDVGTEGSVVDQGNRLKKPVVRTRRDSAISTHSR